MNSTSELLSFIEAATEENWPRIVARTKERGIDIKALCSGIKKLCDEDHVSVPFTEEDFDD